jgi:hypothetical protein
MPRSSLSSVLPALRFLAPSVPKLAVEIREVPAREPFLELVEQGRGVGYLSSNMRFARLPDYESKGQAFVEPTNLAINFQLHGDVMDISASLWFKPAVDGKLPKAEENPPRLELGSYQGRLGDTMSLDKMTELGFQPVTIKIISAERHSTSLPILTHVPSITARAVSQDHVGYTVSLQNLSAQAVMAFSGRDALKGGGVLQAESRGGVPVIAANADHEVPVPCRDDRDAGPTDFDREQGPCAFVLDAALFADGSYEGEVDAAAMLALGMLSRESQLLRVRQALQAALDDKDVPESSRFAQVRAAVSNLTYEPDPSIREKLRAKFPGASDSVLGSIDAITQSEFYSTQTVTLLNLKGIEDSRWPSQLLSNLLASPEMN